MIVDLTERERRALAVASSHGLTRCFGGWRPRRLAARFDNSTVARLARLGLVAPIGAKASTAATEAGIAALSPILTEPER